MVTNLDDALEEVVSTLAVGEGGGEDALVHYAWGAGSGQTGQDTKINQGKQEHHRCMRPVF